jgi:nucleotide-binding universal stress UspA family protein
VPHDEIVALATDERADLVVIGTHGRGGVNRALLGSVADRVVRLSPCPVLTIREPA